MLIAEYELDRDELASLWLSRRVAEEEVVVDTPNFSLMKRSELQDMCRAKGLHVSGTKPELIERLKKALPKPQPKTQKKLSTADLIVRNNQRSANSDFIHIRRNLYDKYEHMETGLVFDELTQMVVGRQMDDGSVGALTDADYEVCKERGFDCA